MLRGNLDLTDTRVSINDSRTRVLQMFRVKRFAEAMSSKADRLNLEALLQPGETR